MRFLSYNLLIYPTTEITERSTDNPKSLKTSPGDVHVKTSCYDNMQIISDILSFIYCTVRTKGLRKNYLLFDYYSHLAPLPFIPSHTSTFYHVHSSICIYSMPTQPLQWSGVTFHCMLYMYNRIRDWWAAELELELFSNMPVSNNAWRKSVVIKTDSHGTEQRGTAS